MVIFPFGDPITVITRVKTGVDEFGIPIYDETEVAVTGAFAPTGGFESSAADNPRDQVVSQPQAYLPSGTVIDSNSVLVIRGNRYEADGEPSDWRNPFTGWQPGIAVPLKRTTG